jgi:hypothetical protein
MFESISTGPRKDRIVFGATLAVFVVINLWNRCTPGWCYEYGWPVTFYDLSDVIIIFNGVAAPRGFFVLPFLIDLVIALAAAAAASAAARPPAG